MNHRWTRRIGIVACLGMVGFIALLWWSVPVHRISRAGANRIQKGMTLDRVVELLRVPAGDYTTPGLSREALEMKFLAQMTFLAQQDFGRPSIVAIERRRDIRYWFCDSGYISVTFDSDGRMTEKHFASFPWTFTDKVRGWLRIR